MNDRRVVLERIAMCDEATTADPVLSRRLSRLIVCEPHVDGIASQICLVADELVVVEEDERLRRILRIRPRCVPHIRIVD